MTDQLIIEPEARLLVELGQERGVLYEDELMGLAQELDLDSDDVQALRDELAGLGVEIVDPPAPEERVEVVDVEIATTNSLDLFLRQAGRYPLLTKDEEFMLAKAIESGDPVACLVSSFQLSVRPGSKTRFFMNSPTALLPT